MNKKQSWELCKCKAFGGYTIGYICRICKKPIYTEEQAKEVDRLREEGDKKQSWEDQLQSLGYQHNLDDCMPLIRKCIVQEIKQLNTELDLAKRVIDNNQQITDVMIGEEIESTKQEIIKKLEEKKLNSLDTFYSKSEIEYGFETAYNKGIEDAIEVVKNI